MRIFSIYPAEESEKAISNYTKQLIKNQVAQGIDVTPLDYIAGDYSTLDLDYIKKGDVVHIQHEYNLFGQFGLPFFKFYKTLRQRDVKIITTMHNVLSKKHKFRGNFIKTILRKMLYKYQNQIINISSDKVIVHAKFFKKILVEEYGFEEENVLVLEQGIQEDIEMIHKDQAKFELKLEGNVFLIIGSLVPDHGADIILKQAEEIGGTIVVAASNKAINDRNDSRQREWLDHLKEIVKVNKIKNVRFDIKELPYPLWWKYFAAADVVLLPYKAGIGSGIFADCIAAKRPMVTSNIKYFREFQDWKFIEIGESVKMCGNNISTTHSDYAKAIEKIMSTDIADDFEKYTKEYGLTTLAKKYKEIYSNEI